MTGIPLVSIGPPPVQFSLLRKPKVFEKGAGHAPRNGGLFLPFAQPILHVLNIENKMTTTALVERLLMHCGFTSPRMATEVLMKRWIMVMFLTLWCIGQSAAIAQMPTSGPSQSNMLNLMSELSPETKSKIEQLGKMLQQDLNEGKLTEAQIQEELRSGNLEQKLRDLNPEAGPLLDDVTKAMKNHSNPEDLTHLLDGLAGSAQ